MTEEILSQVVACCCLCRTFNFQDIEMRFKVAYWFIEKGCMSKENDLGEWMGRYGGLWFLFIPKGDGYFFSPS